MMFLNHWDYSVHHFSCSYEELFIFLTSICLSNIILMVFIFDDYSCWFSSKDLTSRASSARHPAIRTAHLNRVTYYQLSTFSIPRSLPTPTTTPQHHNQKDASPRSNRVNRDRQINCIINPLRTTLLPPHNRRRHPRAPRRRTRKRRLRQNPRTLPA